MSPAKKRRKRICSRPPRKGTNRYQNLQSGYMVMRNVGFGKVGKINLDHAMGNNSLMLLVAHLTRRFNKSRSRR